MYRRQDRDDDPAAKRRKVRKGTQSCWECKRRKVRCTWASSTDTFCDNCSRRKTICISQEFPEEQSTSPDKTNNSIESRLSRVERLLERLTEQVSTFSQHYSPHASDTDESATSLRTSRLQGKKVSREIEGISIEGINSNQQPHELKEITPQSTCQSPCSFQLSDYTGLARDLMEAWPHKADLDFIYNLPACLSAHLHMTLYPSSRLSEGEAHITPQSLLQLPPPASHPILFARKLLLLASLLQDALSTAHMIPAPKRAHFTFMMSQALATASKLVTSHDSLTVSVEGLESIMIEAMIHNYAGDLNKAWMTTRRACTIAQMKGLHRRQTRSPSSSSLSSLKMLDPATKHYFNAQYLSFRIMEMDRYTSMTLGLPMSSLGTYFEFTNTTTTANISSNIDNDAFVHLPSMDRMAHVHVFISGLLLSRTGCESPSEISQQTQEISHMLHSVAAAMPAAWWLIPSYEASGAARDASVDTFHEMARLNYQCAHYHILIRLHLPYVLDRSPDSRFDDSKVVAVTASRELLTRSLAFRTWIAGQCYCRTIDYLSFVAFVVLCIAHVDQSNGAANHAQQQSLQQNRPSDCALMERMVGILDAMDNDAIAMKLSRIMHHLLDVEAAAANGAEFSTVASAESDEEGATDYDGHFVDEAKTMLQLRIPYFGSINLQRRVISKSHGDADGYGQSALTVAQTDLGQASQPLEDVLPLFFEWDAQWSQLDPSQDLYATDDWTLQNINEGLFGDLFRSRNE